MTSNENRKYLFLSEHTKINQIHSLVDGTSTPKKKSKDLLLFLHKIVVKMVSNNCKETKNDGYVQISKKERRDILGEQYVKWTKLLIQAGEIEVAKIELLDKESGELEVVEAFAKGKTCKQYRIKNFTGYKRYEITDDEYFLERMQVVSKNYRMDENEIYRLLKSNVDKLHLIDSEEARNELNDYYKARRMSFSGDAFRDMFNSNVFDISIDDFGNRFQSTHARMKKTFRKYLRFRGAENEVLWNVDMVNSQPFLFSQINSSLIKLLVPECSEAIPVFQFYETRPDAVNYRLICSQGKIYEHIVKAFEKHFGYKINRKEAKGAFYYACFGTYPDDFNDVIEKTKKILRSKKGMYDKNGMIDKIKFKTLSLYIFQKLFPSMYSINEEMKSFNWNHLEVSKRMVKSWANPCLLLQRCESSLLLLHVIPEMLSRNVTEFVTIHDSFLVKKKDVAKVKKSIKKVFQKFGIDQPMIEAKSTMPDD